MVPRGWSDYRINDLLEGLESGVSVNGENRQLCPDEKGVLKVSAVSYGTFDPKAVKAIEIESELKRAKTHPKKDQVIISRSNTEYLVGASAYVDRDYKELYLPDKLWQTIPKLNTSMKWLSYFLSSEHARYTLSNLATGTSGSMKNITKGEFLSLKVATPPYIEQCKIANILGTWDKAISTTERLIDNSKQQKKALMQQLLTGAHKGKRLLDDSGKPFEADWKKVNLGDCIEHTGGTALEKHVIDDALHHFISIGNYSMDGKYIDKGQRIELNSKTKTKLLNKNDLVMVLNDKTKTGDIIGSTILIEEDNKYIYNQRSERIVPNKEINVKFFSYSY